MPEVSGRTLLIHDLANRLETAPGTLGWDEGGADYGYDVRALLNTKRREPKTLTGRIVDELVKDDRVKSAKCTANWEGGDSLRLYITVTDGDGPFPFTLSVTNLTVDILTKGP